MQLQLLWGQEERKNFNLPDRWNFSGLLQGKKVSPLPHLKDSIRRSLREPVHSRPLCRGDLAGKRVTLVIDDLTRPTPVAPIFEVLLHELREGGVRERDLRILFALGTHRPMTNQEMLERLGVERDFPGLLKNHNCFDHKELSLLGKNSRGDEVWVNTLVREADLVIVIGTIEPHLITGFGGGLKNIIPGCAGMETIASTHLYGRAEDRFHYLGHDGLKAPIRSMIERDAQLITGEYFLINTVLTPEGEVAGIFTGDPIKAHRKGCQLAGTIYAAEVKTKADVVITSSYPMDIDLRQGSKCLAYASRVLKDDGLLIAFLRTYQGIGDLKIPDYYQSPASLRPLLKRLGVEEVLCHWQQECGPMEMDEEYMQSFLLEMSRRHHVLVYGPHLPSDTGERLGAFHLFSQIDTLLERALHLRPQGEVVYFIPTGGVTYGVLTE